MRRILSVLVLITFVSTNQFVLPVYAADSASVPVNTKSFPSDLSKLEVPKEMGKIQEFYKGKGKEVVVLIQDAHAIPDAQRSIQKLIDYFQREYGVSLVALEGASSELDPQIFRSFPDKELLQKVFQEYQARGELAGGTAAAIFNQSQSVYRGIEEWGLYEKGLTLYLEAMKKEPEISKKLEALRKELEEKKAKTYSKELLEIDSLLEKFYTNHSNLFQVLKKLADIKEPAPGSEIALLTQEIKRDPESSQPIEKEVKKIALKINHFLKSKTTSPEGKSKLLAFNEKSQQFQTSQITPEAFALFLKELMEGAEEFQISKRLARLIQNQKRLQDIEGTRFFRNFERYVEEVKTSLLKDEEGRKLDRKTKHLHLLERFARLELNHEDWTKLNHLLASSLRAPKGRSNPGDRFVTSFLAMTGGMKFHFKFYEAAKKRDEVFFTNLQNLMKKERQNKELVVVGGFHAEGLTAKLKEQNVSYFLLAPHMDSIPKETNYRAHMRGEVSWKDYFQVENGRVSLYRAFVRATRDKLLARHSEAEGRRISDPSPASGGLRMTTESAHFLKSWRDQVIRDLAEKEQITKAHQYTSFIDEITQKSTGLKKQDKRMAPIERFIQGLERLEATKQLNEKNVLKLLQPATTQTPAGPAVADPAVSLPATLFGLSVVGEGPSVLGAPAVPASAVTSFRSEVRSEDLTDKDLMDVKQTIAKNISSVEDQDWAWFHYENEIIPTMNRLEDISREEKTEILIRIIQTLHSNVDVMEELVEEFPKWLVLLRDKAGFRGKDFKDILLGIVVNEVYLDRINYLHEKGEGFEHFSNLIEGLNEIREFSAEDKKEILQGTVKPGTPVVGYSGSGKLDQKTA